MTKEKYFNSGDVKWIKSVTRDKGNAWAYLDVKVGDIFPLNFSKNPKWYPTNYLKAKPQDIITLFQTLQSDWYVTHLVTPIDENIEKINNQNHPYIRLVTVIAVNSNPTKIDSTRWSLYKCNRGQICGIKTVEQRNNSSLTTQQKQEFIWGQFNNINTKLIHDISDFSNKPDDIEDYIANEGTERTILKLHKFRERDIKIVKQAKAKAKNENRLFCEACLFDFEKQYPSLGEDFIECHHIQPISKGGIRQTKVEDLAIVCSNCHRMLHKKDNNGNYLTLIELSKIITKKFN